MKQFLIQLAQAAKPDPVKEAGAQAEAARQTIETLIAHYVGKIILPVAAFVVGAFFFFGVAKYFTAYGDESKAESAKKTITWAVVGALVVLLSYGIVKWVNSLVGQGGTGSFTFPTN